MRISLVQMKVVDGAPEANLAQAEALIRSQPGAELYLLPELWAVGYAREAWQDYVRHHHGTVLARMTALGEELNASIGGSYIARHEEGDLANRFLLLTPAKGTAVLAYDKVHLFAPLDEDKHLVAGHERVSGQLGEWRVHLSICYDLRFPEMYRAAALEGSHLFLIVAQWPQERCHHMVALAQARAIENQAYVALCNRIGPSQEGLDFGGQSGIWTPDGTPLATGGDEETVISATIDLGTVTHLREAFPVLNSRIKNVDY